MESDVHAVLSMAHIAIVEAAQRSSMERVSVSAIRCRAGCHACCNRFIALTIAEAAVMVRAMQRSGSWPHMRKSVEAVRDVAAAASPQAWYKIGIPCPLLVNGMCAAYDVRPVACSLHHVLSDPEACDGSSAAAKSYEPYRMPKIYAQFIAALDSAIKPGSVLRVSAPLPLALLFADAMLSKKFKDLDELVSSTAEFNTR